MTASMDRPVYTVHRRRDEFPSLATGTYLMSHSQGPLPRGTAQALQEFVRLWEGHGPVNSWDAAWWKLPDEIGDHIARIIGAPSGSVHPQASASMAMQVAASCLDFSGSRRCKPHTRYFFVFEQNLTSTHGFTRLHLHGWSHADIVWTQKSHPAR